MYTGTVELLAFGLIAIVSGLFLLSALVRELAPDERRKWFLGIGLGTGVIAFSLKIGLIVLFSIYPSAMLSIFPKQEYPRASLADLTDELDGLSARQVSYTWEALPRSAPYPPDNPVSAEKVALGRKLFFDKRLSADGSVACASCHELSEEKAGGDGHSTSIGIKGQHGSRNAPTVFNAAFQQFLFWDGRAASLEEQAKGPLVNPIEMGMPSFDSVVERVRNVPEYQQLFLQAFDTEPAVTIDNIAKAIATFERTLITPDSPYDRYVRGDSLALSERQLQGMALFESLGCVMCHSGPNFSGASVFQGNTPFRIFPSVPHTSFETKYSLIEDRGVASTSNTSDRGVWRIPSLRNVSRTAPYFHNGSVETLNEAVRIMARVQLNKKLSNRNSDDSTIIWSAKEHHLTVSRNQALSDTEIDDIVAFLESLDGAVPASY